MKKILSFWSFVFFIYGESIIKHINFSMKDLTISEKNSYSLLSLKGGFLSWIPGSPQIPFFPYQIILPQNFSISSIKVEYKNPLFISLPALLHPVQKPVPLTMNSSQIGFIPPLDSFYHRSVYPFEGFYRYSIGKLPEYKIVNFILAPVFYRPFKNQIVFYRDIEIKIDYRSISRIEKTEGNFDYLIITSEQLKNAFENLKRWKMKKGLLTKIRTVEWINNQYSGRDLAEKIRNYVKKVVSDSGVKWVLLGGDTDIIPDRKAFAMPCSAFFHEREDSLPADLYYVDVEGTWDEDNDGIFGEVEDSVDLYPDAFVGRAPVRSLEEAEIFVNKVINYETSPDTTYEKDLLFLGEILWRNPYTDGGKGKDMIGKLYVPYQFNIKKLYESLGNENPISVKEEIMKGKNIINHNGHGWINIISVGQGHLSNEDIFSLRNPSKYGILFSVGCWTGAFDFDCIGEAFIRNPEGGGVGYIGNSSYGWGSPGNPGFGYSDVFDSYFFKEIFEENKIRIGEALALAKASFIPFSKEKNVYRWHQYQINLLGDPEMSIWLDNPKKMRITAPDSGTDEMILPIYVDFNGIPLDSVLVTLTDEDTIYAKEYTDRSGKAEIRIKDNFPPLLSLNCWKHNFIPFSKEIVIVHKDVYLSYSSPNFDDSLGNADGYVDPSDTVLISLYVKNSGLENANNVEIFLHPKDSGIKVLDSVEYVGEIKGMDSVFVENCFSIYIEKDQRYASVFELEIRNSEDVWIYPFTIPLGVPRVSIEHPAIKTENGFIMPGESKKFSFYLVNKGDAIFYDGMIFLISLKEGIDFSTDSFVVDRILPKDSIHFETFLQVSSLLSAGEVGRFKIKVLGKKDTIEKSVEFVIGKTGFEDDFEEGLSWEQEGSPKLWHVTSIEKKSGKYSLYCGKEDEEVYENNMENSILSPEFTIPVKPLLQFYRKYEFPIYGVDGVYVEVLYDGKIDTIDFTGTGGALEIKDDWALVSYELNVPPGTKARVRFRFISDEEGVARGIFIDDVKVKGEGILKTTGIQEEKKKKEFEVLSDILSLRLVVPKKDFFKIKVYDGTGRMVREVFSGYLRKGVHEIQWNKRDDSPKLPSGVYFIIIESKRYRRVIKSLMLY